MAQSLHYLTVQRQNVRIRKQLEPQIMDAEVDTVEDFGWFPFEEYLGMFKAVHGVAALHSVLNSV